MTTEEKSKMPDKKKESVFSNETKEEEDSANKNFTVLHENNFDS